MPGPTKSRPSGVWSPDPSVVVVGRRSRRAHCGGPIEPGMTLRLSYHIPVEPATGTARSRRPVTGPPARSVRPQRTENLLTGTHSTLGSRPTGDGTGAAPTNTDPGVAALAVTVMDELADAFSTIDWAEDEITR